MNRLQAVKAFLDSVKGTSGFGDTCRMQAEHVQSLLNAMSVQPENVAGVTAMLRDMPWPESDTQASLAALNEACARSVRVKLQNYLSLQSYFTEAQWATMLGTDHSHSAKLEVFLMHLAALGLRNPDERTMQFVTALYLQVTEGAAADRMAGSAMHASLQHVKQNFKRLRLPAAQGPQKLPTNPAQFMLEFPALAHVAFAGELPVIAGKYPGGQLTAIAMRIPMRRRDARVPLYEFGGGGGSGQLTQAAAAMMQQMQQMQQLQSMTLQMLSRGGTSDWSPSPLAAGVMAGLVAPPPMRALPCDRSSSSGSFASPSHALPEEPNAEEELSGGKTQPLAPSSQPPLPPPLDCEASSSTPKKMSVDDATQHILKAIANKSAAKSTVCKKPAACEAVIVDEPSEEEPMMKRPAGKGKPHYGIEHTRKQVMCRTGRGGPGSSFAIPYGTEGLEAAKKKAEKWLAKELKAQGF